MITTKKWTPEEEEYLLASYYTEDLDTMCKHLGCGGSVIREKARDLRHAGKEFLRKDGTLRADKVKGEDVNKPTKEWNKWTEEQVELLRNNWKLSTMNELLIMFPGRTYGSIMAEAIRLDLVGHKKDSGDKAGYWTDAEIEILRNAEDVVRAKELLPDRTTDAIKYKLRHLGLTKPRNKNGGITKRKSNTRWSEKELEILKKHYPELGGGVVNMLPGRSQSSIWVKASKLGLKFDCDLYNADKHVETESTSNAAELKSIVQMITATPNELSEVDKIEQTLAKEDEARFIQAQSEHQAHEPESMSNMKRVLQLADSANKEKTVSKPAPSEESSFEDLLKNALNKLVGDLPTSVSHMELDPVEVTSKAGQTYTVQITIQRN